MSTENINTEDLHDQFLDRALREVVGGETPPDLSEQIMLAATGESSSKRSTLASARHEKRDALSQAHRDALSQRNQRIGIAIAATVLVGSLVVFPISLAKLEQAKQQPIAKAEQDRRVNLNAAGNEDRSVEESAPIAEQDSESPNQDLSISSLIPGTFQPRNSTREWNSSLGRPSKRDLKNSTPASEPNAADFVESPQFESAPVESTFDVDTDGTVVIGGLKDSSGNGTQASQPSHSELQMTVTPHIIIQEQEEQRLGIVTESLSDRTANRPAVDAKGGSMPAQVGLQGLITDAYGAIQGDEFGGRGGATLGGGGGGYGGRLAGHAGAQAADLPALAAASASPAPASPAAASPAPKSPGQESKQNLPSTYFAGEELSELAKQQSISNGQANEGTKTFAFSMGFGRGVKPNSGTANQPQGELAANSRDFWGVNPQRQSQITDGPTKAGTPFRIEASPGPEVNRYLSTAPAGTESNPAQSDRLAVKVNPVPDLVMPVETPESLGDLGKPEATVDPQLRLVDEAEPDVNRDSGLHASGNPERIARERQELALKQEVERKLKDKISVYHDLSAEIGGALQPKSNSKLTSQIGEAHTIQQQLLRQKEELLDLEVQKQLIRKQTTAPASMDNAVELALKDDPTLEVYRAQEFAMKQQLRTLRSGSKTGSSSQIRRLESRLQSLQEEAHTYSSQAEREIREQIKAAPNTVLDMATTEFALRRRAIEAKIHSLNRQYQTKIDAVNKMGEVARLDLLELEIKELQQQLHQGKGPDASGDKYARIHENPFIKAEGEKAVSTFSIDVDTAAYANVRQFLMQSGQLPPPDAVRIEELVNYFDYDYTPPTDDTPFASHVEIAGCPWKAGHRLVRVGIKGREIDTQHRPQSNLVFLIDVSGSMNDPSKLPLLVDGMKMLTRELGENDRIAIVVYASSEGLALPSTRGDQQGKILSVLDNLRAGGSTAGGAGIQLAYEIAEKNFIQGGVNRVILATDGDFNVGVTNPADLQLMAEEKAKQTGVFLTTLGFGRGNLNDDMMEKISNAGNGNYYYIDNTTEARKVLVAEMAGTLVTIAKDVKIQVEFNPAEVAAYRLIGYENRMLKTEDFNDDKKDAGEIGAGHTVTAIYEVIPAGMTVDTPAVDELKYQQQAKAKPTSDVDDSGEMLTLKLRYKQPDEDVSTKLEFPITDNEQSFAKASDDFKFASAVASFGMLLRHSAHQGHTSYSAVEEIANDGLGKDKHGYRAEFLQLVRRAKQLAGE